MAEYYQLKQDLLIWTFAMSGVIFLLVWLNYSLHIALSYLLGACVGIVYLRMLAKNVERLGEGKTRVSSNRLALFAGLIIVATQWQQLHIVPIFLGFLTYKAAIIAYTFQTAFSEFMKR
jgi:ATP synthase protein I